MIQLTDATVVVNNEVVGTVPGSVEIDEGLGEQDMKAVSIGGGKVEQLYVEDVETKFGECKFEMYVTPEGIELARSWKVNKNRNVAQFVGSTAEGTVTRTYTQAALTENYKIPVSPDGTMEIRFKANTPI